MPESVPSAIVPGADLSLSAVLGFEQVSGKEATMTTERVEGVVAWLRKVVKELPGLGLFDVAPGIVTELARVLSTPLSKVGIALWNQRKEIRKYADETQYPPTEVHVVELDKHELKQVLKPTVEIRLNGRPLTSVALKLSAIVTLKGVKLVIRGGWITHLRLGELNGKAVLEVTRPEILKELKLKEVQAQPWKLDREIALPGRGVRIPR